MYPDLYLIFIYTYMQDLPTVPIGHLQESVYWKSNDDPENDLDSIFQGHARKIAENVQKIAPIVHFIIYFPTMAPYEKQNITRA